MPPAGAAAHRVLARRRPCARDALSDARARSAIAEDWFRAAGMVASWVDTERRNARALRMYAKLGYRAASEAFGQVLLEKVL